MTESSRMSATQGCSDEEMKRFEEAKSAGNTAFRERRYRDAIAHYTNAESINPCVAVIPANRAMAQLKLENWDAVNADATVALALQDEFAMEAGHFGLRVKCYLRRALARSKLGRPQLATEDYREVLKIEPNNSDAKNALQRLGGDENVGNAGGGSAPKITVVDEQLPAKNDVVMSDTNGVGTATTRGTNGLVRDFPLLRIGGVGDSGALSELTKKWASTPPRNVTEFERAWKSMRGQDVRRAEYLLLIGATRVRRGLFGNSMTSQLLSEIVSAFRSYPDGDAKSIVEVFHAICGVQRIDIAIMLLSENFKQITLQCCDEWGKCDGVDSSKIAHIRSVMRD